MIHKHRFEQGILIIWMGFGFHFCAPSGEGTLIIGPDQNRLGQNGTQGPFGVAVYETIIPARISESFSCSILYPANSEAHPDLSRAPYPLVLLIHGGLVDKIRYRWLAEQFTSRGYVVAVPAHPLDLAILEINNGQYALDQIHQWSEDDSSFLHQMVDPDADIAILGHSLGGVIASYLWVENPQLTSLVMLASRPQDGVPVGSRAGNPVLFLTGDQDLRIDRERIETGFNLYEAPKWFYDVEGMNHYDWVDSPTAEELEQDGASTRPRPETRQASLAVMDAWLDEWHKESTGAFTEGEFTGIIEVES